MGESFAARPPEDRAFVTALVSGIFYSSYLMLYPPQFYSLAGVPEQYRVLFLFYLAFLLLPAVAAGLFFNLYAARIAYTKLRSGGPGNIKAGLALVLNLVLAIVVLLIGFSTIF